MYKKVTILLCFAIIACHQSAEKASAFYESNSNTTAFQNSEGSTLQTRFKAPEGYKRLEVEQKSFAQYLRNLPLKPVGSKVLYYNGDVKENYAYEAVVDMDIGKKDLQQCADAVMRLRAEYFYDQKAYDKISFTLTNGFKVDYSEWIKGNRIVVNGNTTSWQKKGAPSNTYKDFRAYMELIFTYAGTLSLSKSLHTKKINDMAIGDVFIVGGSPGHAVIVVDMAQNPKGEKIFMLAQSYMPAQETQILRNPSNENLSPWYEINSDEIIKTPEWTFSSHQLKTW
jgi:hypothetical protein